MKLLEWNINQRSNYLDRSFIPEWLHIEIKKVNADIIVLTEFYKNGDWLQKLAYRLEEYNVFSNDNSDGNEILIAIKKEFKILEIKECIDYTKEINTNNFLQIKFKKYYSVYNVIGFRVQKDNKEQQLKELFEYLSNIKNNGEKIIVLGDFNLWDTFVNREYSFLIDYKIQAPKHTGNDENLDNWSYVFESEKRAPIDWCIVKDVKVNNIKYSWDYLKQIGQIPERYKSENQYIGIPDHAQLIVEIEG